ncbi:related to GTPase-activating protein beta-chimerin [Rhynchosporium agropyri]|uniref:Related to GTPase-activating protein beta-chimerin n=1 Tax=Rhynchosporium agropyri TaxID=914238 RepID=A0A1E1KJL0_9HELO|nr:related to GTPase-activating protein beta-chimerin [Rhynchosporium agropyri]
MADDHNSDKLLSEPPEFPSTHHERTGSMSLGAPPNANGDDVSPPNGDSMPTSAPPSALSNPNAKAVHDVTNSEIGVSTLLTRLKQSIASAKEFATFLKKRSTLEEEHSNGLKKLCRIAAENIRRPEHRHGSFLQSYDEITSIHERMSDNGAQFATSLHQMHEDLLEVASNLERGRKHWKTTGLAAEQRVADAEGAMRKSKTKYDSLAEDYDRAKTGDRQQSKKFGLKGPKSAQQHEEDLLRKLRAADEDYASKVQAAQSQKAELLSKLRPEAVKSLEDLIKECDSALTLQMQKFASFNEKLLLSNGLNISPMRGNESGSQPRSLREAVAAIDNEKDLSNYISSFANKVPARTAEIRYEKNPVLNPPSYAPHAPQPMVNPAQRQSDPQPSFGVRTQAPPPQLNTKQPPLTIQNNASPFQDSPPAAQQHERSFSQGPSVQKFGSPQGGGPPRGPTHGPSYGSGSISSSGPPQLSLPFQGSQPPPQQNFHSTPQAAPVQAPYSQSSHSQPPPSVSVANLPPLKPVFGLSLEQLFERDNSAVPMVVYQCIQAVDLFGLEVEGIYRLSGTSSHVSKIKAMFDNDASKVDFRDPANFFHDVNSVAGLLKQFFRDLPDPLLTAEHYPGFIEAAKNEDDTVRRDSLHAIINSLPDPNYATLRALTLHLNRIQENSPVNRMNASNLAIVFGPTLMGANTGPNIQDAGWQVRVIDTILQNVYQIFDDD